MVMTFIRSLSKETCGFQVPCSCNKCGAYCMRSSSTLSRSLVVMGRACHVSIGCLYGMYWCNGVPSPLKVVAGGVGMLGVIVFTLLVSVSPMSCGTTGVLGELGSNLWVATPV